MKNSCVTTVWINKNKALEVIKMSTMQARKLAKELVIQNKMIEKLMNTKAYRFDVWEANGKSYVQTAVCNVGGCTADYLTFDSFKEAEKQSAIMTITGEKLCIVSVCNKCLNESEDDIYCSICGNELMPVYDEYPNWLKYCSTCDFNIHASHE